MPVLFRDDLFLRHDTGPHPECAARLVAIHQALNVSEVAQQYTAGKVVPASPETLALIHPAGYVSRIRTAAQRGGGRLDPDTVVSPDSFDVASCAAGTAAAAVDAVFGAQQRRAVCLVRPPGHHALSQRAMGFCLFNNVAIAAAYARQAHHLDRVLIVDWDVHHGNGTQDIFYADEHVHFFSAHRFPFYPGTGDVDEIGTGAGLGTTFNLPLRFGISRHDYHEAFAGALTKAADRCRPQLVLISAGFDAHRADPIGSLGLESEDFGKLTRMVCDVANQHCEGRIVSLLEGGYNVDALAESVLIHMRVLAEF